MDCFDLLEMAKTAGLAVEPSEVWTYGEGCECKCKWMVVSLEGKVLKHCKTLKQVERTIAHEKAGLKEPEEKLKQWEAESWSQFELKFN